MLIFIQRHSDDLVVSGPGFALHYDTMLALCYFDLPIPSNHEMNFHRRIAVHACQIASRLQVAWHTQRVICPSIVRRWPNGTSILFA